MAGAQRDFPWGIKVLTLVTKRCFPQCRLNRRTLYKGGIFVLTYMAYMSYHMTRKTISVAKGALNKNCTGLSPPPDIIINDTNRDVWCNWAPFDTSEASLLLGILDFAFLFSYAIAMFFSGFIAERVNLRYFLSLGMVASGIACYLFGIASFYKIHNFWYFFVVQVMGGIFQTSGWPGVVTVLSNWFGKGKRGLIFGIWNSHTSLGNILGALIAAEYVESDWGLSFMVPGGIMGLFGFIIFLFLAPNPTDVGCVPPTTPACRKIDDSYASDEGADVNDDDTSMNPGDERIIYRNTWRHQDALDDEIVHTETSPILANSRNSSERHEAIGFFGAIRIPGVIEFSLSLFFAKLVNYTFLYWLPLYIVESTSYGAKTSADMSTVFDIGGIVGGISAGILSDYSGMSALTCAGMLAFATPMLFIYDLFGNISYVMNVVMLMAVGLLVNGPYALITTAVSAELGTHSSLGGNSKALATVTAIIDGTGSIGAAIGPLLVGFVPHHGNWHNVFYMLMGSNLLALLLLSRLVYRELKLYAQRRRAV